MDPREARNLIPLIEHYSRRVSCLSGNWGRPLRKCCAT